METGQKSIEIHDFHEREGVAKEKYRLKPDLMGISAAISGAARQGQWTLALALLFGASKPDVRLGARPKGLGTSAGRG